MHRVLLAMMFTLCLSGFARAVDPWLGKTVFYKDHAVAVVGLFQVDKYKNVSYPATVKEVKGDWLRLGRAWIRKDEVMEVDEALEFYNALVQVRPAHDLGWLRRSIIRGVKGDHQGALADINRSIELEPSEVKFNNRGNVKLRLGDLDGAILDYDEAVRLNPKNASALTCRGEALVRQGKLGEAVKSYDRAIETDDQYAHAYTLRGYARNELQDVEGALQDLDKSISLNPDSAYALNHRGRVKMLAAKYPEAKADFDAAIRISPEFWIISNRGVCQQFLGNQQGAKSDHEEALKLAPENASVAANLSFFLSTCPAQSVRDPLRSLQLAEQALKKDPQNGYVISALACAKALNGDFAEAIKLSEEALKDKGFAADKQPDGGVAAQERIAAWQQKKQWFFPGTPK